jgi:hypothetical protein
MRAGRVLRKSRHEGDELSVVAAGDGCVLLGLLSFHVLGRCSGVLMLRPAKGAQPDCEKDLTGESNNGRQRRNTIIFYTAETLALRQMRFPTLR